MTAQPPALSADALAHYGDPRSADDRAQSVALLCQSYQHFLRGYGCDTARLLTEGRMAAESAKGQEISAGPIPFYSLCAHHLLPFFGTVSITYRAGEWILGLGKFPQLVEALAARATLQENLTADLADALALHLAPQSLSVTLEARHLCLEMRHAGSCGTALTTRASR